MARQRIEALRAACLLSLGLFLLMEGSIASRISLTPHRAFRKRFKWSKIRRFVDKAQDDLSSDLLDQMDEATRKESKEVPNPIASMSQMVHDGVNCSALQSNLHPNNIDKDIELRPSWILRSELIGDCPTDYVTKELPPKYYPPVVLEAVCKCERSQCSNSGHQCIPVNRNIPVWIRHGPDQHVLDVYELTVACVCAKRVSREANSVMMAALRS